MSFGNNKIGILGDGAMGQAISHILLQNGNAVEIFSRKIGNISTISSCDVLFLCIPSGIITEVVDIIQNIPIIVSCSKGLANTGLANTGLAKVRLSGQNNFFISKLFSKGQFCVLAGPNFASEIITNVKTITTLASEDEVVLKTVTKMIAGENLIVEMTDDVVGVEICGIVKNAMAIIMGYKSAVTESWNEKSLVLTQSFQELSRILTHFGCNKSTLELSCGIGDIYLTCSTTNSRNFKFGASFAKDLKEVEGTVEGIRSFEFISTLALEIPVLKEFAAMFLK